MQHQVISTSIKCLKGSYGSRVTTVHAINLGEDMASFYRFCLPFLWAGQRALN